MKYKVGDEVLIKAEITDVHEGTDKPYYVQPCYDSYYWVSEEKIIPMDKTYEMGLKDAWELVRKLCALEPDEREKMFKYCSIKAIIEHCTIEEVMDSIEAYEREKSLGVGDEVVDDEEPKLHGVITSCDGPDIYVMWNDGSCGRDSNPASLKKTGKHIDIESLLRQIGE